MSVAAPVQRERTIAALGHPPALYMLFFTELWERFSYYGMRALLTLYIVKHMGLKDAEAVGIAGAYGALVYGTPVIGGLLADRVIGYRRAIVLGGILMAAGHFMMAVEATWAFYTALSLLILGNGLFKPNISSLVGKLYEENDPRRDNAFTIFYMGINLGAFLAPLTCGVIGETIGWHYGFALAGVGMVIGLVIFWMNQRLLGVHGRAPETMWKGPLPGVHRGHLVALGALALVPAVAMLVVHNDVLGSTLTVFGLVVLGGLLYTAFTSPPVERDRLLTALVLIFFSIVFWAFFEQASTSITLFTDRNVDRSLPAVVGDWYVHRLLPGIPPTLAAELPQDLQTIPTSTFQAVNPFWIVLLGPVFAALWTWLRARGWEPSTPVKFALGLAQVGLGFAAFVVGAWLAPSSGLVGVWFLVLGYLLHTTGELCLSPVGLSMITKLSPGRLVGVMMGAWFLSISFAQHVGALIAALTASSDTTSASVVAAHGVGAGIVAPATGGVAGAVGAVLAGVGAANAARPPPAMTLGVYTTVFEQIALFAVVSGLIVWALSPLLRRGMHGVQ